MEQLPVNPACSLSGTEYCRQLNMHSCEKCTIEKLEDKESIRRDIDLYETLLPAGGVARLFTSKECQFCKGEPKGKRTGYAILDMAHPEPKRMQKWLLGERVSRVGTMIPVQMSICTACRRKLLAMDYLPTVVPVAFGLAGLGLLAIDAVVDPLSSIGKAVPFLAWALLIAAGYGIGKLLAASLKKKADAVMLTDALEHPVLRAMEEKGWQPVVKQSSGTKLLFSKSRMARGLGTAPDAPENPENQEKN